MTLRYGYISNGFADHSLTAMIGILEGLGYTGIGITLDHHHLDPFHVTDGELVALRERLEGAGLTPVIETGGRYLLDPLRKHWPNLVSGTSGDRTRRLDLYRRAMEIAGALGASVVSLWSGAPDSGSAWEGWDRLTESLPPVLDAAVELDVKVGFEPEPGMLVESLADLVELRRRVPHPALGLTLDLGHLAITEDPPLEAAVTTWAEELVNVHIDDVRDRRHEHLPLGEGELDFPPLLGALRDVGYEGLVLVELSRHSHEAPLLAARSIATLRGWDHPGS